MSEDQKRILLALDGSGQSLDAVRYVSRILSPQRTELVLFHVLNTVPEAYWDLEQYPGYRGRVIHFHAWQAQQKREIEEFMEQAHQLVLERGFPQEAVTVNIQERKVGIARDIAFESQRGFDAVVLGRTGTSPLKDLVLGTIANKLIGKVIDVPLWVIGGQPDPGKVLLAVDKSERTTRSVEYVGSMLAGSGSQITLFHAVRDLHAFQKSNLTLGEENWSDRVEKNVKKAREEMESLFEEAKARLIKIGLNPDRVRSKIVLDVVSRAGAILEEAKKEGYGTIVVGRRGLSRVQEFFMGRVSNKVVQLAKEMAVWVVS